MMQQHNKSDKARTGPRPLWLHMNGLAYLMASESSADKNVFRTSQSMLQRAMNGIKAYHNSMVKPFRRPMRIIAEEEGSRVLCPEGWAGDKFIVLIPSLINGWHIFDIEEQHSLMAYLYAQGIMPLVIEWAEPQDNISMAQYITHHLKPLLDKLLSEGYDISALLGYCMGATFIPALYSLYPDFNKAIDKVVLVAPPWDFSYQTTEQRIRLQSMTVPLVAMGDVAPVDYVQSLFWAIDPLQVIRKFMRFPDVENPDRFVRVEDWLNEGQPVSKSVIETCLYDWYRDNKIVTGEWVIDGVTITKENLPESSIIVAGENDNLVPMASINPLVKRNNLTLVKTGHIGLMASDKVVKKWWKPIAQFLNCDIMPPSKER